jgi:hypothetical protein
MNMSFRVLCQRICSSPDIYQNSELEWSHKTQSKSSTGGEPKLPMWIRPPTGLTKMNVDGAVWQHRRKGLLERYAEIIKAFF